MLSCKDHHALRSSMLVTIQDLVKISDVLFLMIKTSRFTVTSQDIGVCSIVNASVQYQCSLLKVVLPSVQASSLIGR